ncbi:heme oxygenase [Cadophora gregata]|uniref:heme oxygenase n=1 Tax=Cadophora gregata TaxID=51156 RepID=UPI0026DD98B8|nr:heme oxygenase [Cadophora gregata]KAK0124241.1 heme oxygenase [Cadophora gregata]KAK0129906.1 heme oxygenase [Cadophora gregata f. sp. sojae]
MFAHHDSEKMSDSSIPTPSPMPSPPINPHSLSERINISTRPLHTQLNRLILTRLPLALPPYTTNPSTYVSGLFHIAPIYSTFEDLWGALLSFPQLPTTLQTNHDACDPGQPLLDSKSIPLVSNSTQKPTPMIHTPKICTRTHSLLSHLRMPGLLRAGRLLADIRTLTNTPDHQITAQLRAISHSGPLAEFLQHTKTSVEANPHVLLAYAWVLYMALFSGGRYLRAALKEAGGQGDAFWSRESSPVRPYSIDDSAVPPRSTSRPDPRTTPSSTSETNTAPTRVQPTAKTLNPRLPPPEPNAKPVPGLSFFSFTGDSDGEDLKTLFKSRIAEAEVLLTVGEKDDIVLEAQHIFTYMLQLVNQLDAVVGTTEFDIAASASTARGRPLNASRDSISVAKERMSRLGTLEKTDDVTKCVAGMEGKGESKSRRGFLDVVAGPVARVIMFKGRLPSFDQVVRRFSSSKTGTSQVIFVDEHEVKTDGVETEGSEKDRITTTSRSTGESVKRSVLKGLPTPTMAVLLLFFFILYRLK